MAEAARRRLLLPLFFASGFAALLYQMIWQRMLTFFGGADVYSITLIVSAFMAGLGFGSLAGGHLADRLSLRGRFATFALAELAIALFAFASVWLLYDVLFLGLGATALSRPAVGGIVFAALLWPTFFMGMSLPLLAKTVTGARPEAWIGALYGVNTLGAALGSLLTVWVLARAMGFDAVIRLGAWLNLACAAGGAALAWGAPAGAERQDARGDAPPAPQPSATFAFPLWLLLYTLSGFVALSLEILWFRILGIALKSTAFTFGTVLALYLSGVGLGSLAGSLWARRSRRPAVSFLVLQSGIAAYAAVSLGLLAASAGELDATRRLVKHLASHDAFDVEEGLRALAKIAGAPGGVAQYVWSTADLFLTLYAWLPLFLVGVPTLLMGMSFPFLQKAAQTDPSVLGRRVGWLQTANILGSTLGAILTGLGLLHWLGSAWTLRVLAALGGVFLFLAGRILWRERAWPRRLAAAGALAATAGIAYFAPSPGALWAALHGTEERRILFAEDGSGVAVLRAEDEEAASRTVVFSGGLFQSQIPYSDYHTLLGALPVMLHPKPEAVAIIGLGSGNTVFAAGGRAETRRLDCIEIVAPQLRALKLLAPRRPYPELAELLREPRIRYAFTDGRAFILRGEQRYDVIEADALRPTSAYSGNLYSYEYFRLVRSRLRPGGLGVSWGPTRRIEDTFRRAFPHVFIFDKILVGSDAPIVYERDAIAARLRDPFTRGYYARAGIDIERIFSGLLAKGPDSQASGLAPSRFGDVNTDLFPKDEYLVPR